MGGCEKKFRGGGYAGEGKEDKMRGGGGCVKNFEGGGMPETVKKTKCGGCCEKKLRRGGVCRRG